MVGYKLERKSCCFFYLLIPTVVAFLVGCHDNLPLKAEIETRVLDSLTMLELTDLSTGARVRPGDTVSWPDTAYTETTQKIFRIANKGDSTISLVGPAPVTISGGSGQEAFSDGINQPGLSTLPPGTSTEFTLSFNPGTPDIDYSCKVVLGSDDPELPGYSFTASGRSTQWHGSKVIDSSDTDPFISPHLHIDGNTVYATYASSSAGAIKIRRSIDGGLNWGNAFGGQFAGAYPHLTALTGASAANAGLHIMYYNGNQISYNKNLNNNWKSNIVNEVATAGSGEKIFGSLLLRDGVFLTWYDTSTQSLWYNYSYDPRGAEGPEPDGVYTSFSTPIRLTGEGTGRIGGQYHSMARDSSGNLYLAYCAQTASDEKDIMIVRAASSDFSAGSCTIYDTGCKAQEGGISIALSESGAAVIAFIARMDKGSNNGISILRAHSNYLDNWTVKHIGGYSHSFVNFCFLINELGNLYVLHQASGANGGIILSISTDSGATWNHRSLDSHASLAGGAFMSHLALDLSGQTIYSAYTTGNAHPNGYSVTLMKSIDGGATW